MKKPVPEHIYRLDSGDYKLTVTEKYIAIKGDILAMEPGDAAQLAEKWRIVLTEQWHKKVQQKKEEEQEKQDEIVSS